MKIKEIVEQIGRFAPWETALEWDNVGLLVGRKNDEADKAVVCLDIDENALQTALEVGAGLIVSHHPLFIRPLAAITDQTLLQIVEQGIAVICVHTNLDIAPKGVNYELANLLGLKNFQPISQSEPIGLIGEVQKQKLSEFATSCKNLLKAPFAKVYKLQEFVQTVAVCGGNGSSLLQILDGKADVLVSSDFKYHQIIDSKISLIDVGHYWSERVAIEILQKILEKMGIKTFVPKTHKIEKLEVL